MQPGDLIQFRLNFPPSSGDWVWTRPALVIEPDEESLWIVLVRGRRCVIDEGNYEIQHLTNTLQH